MLNGACDIADIQNLRDEAREMLIDDLRDDGYKLIDIQLLMDVLHILQPMINSKSTKQHKFDEVNIPTKMRGRKSYLDRLEGLINPDHLTVNEISDQIPRDQADHPPLTPYPTAGFLASPWISNGPGDIRIHEGSVLGIPVSDLGIHSLSTSGF